MTMDDVRIFADETVRRAEEAFPGKWTRVTGESMPT
jgi:hypothetical protein